MKPVRQVRALAPGRNQPASRAGDPPTTGIPVDRFAEPASDAAPQAVTETEQPRRMRRSLMATLRELRDKAQARADADAEVIATRFRKQDRARIRRFAATSFAHCDLAEQFPMLAYMLALKLVDPVQREAAEAALQAGETLPRIAKAAGVPVWTRAIPAGGCENPEGMLPQSADFTCRISALLRRRTENEEDMRGLLRMTAQMHGWAGEELALWLAYRTPENGFAEQLPAPFRMLVLWYLFSRLKTGIGRELIHTPWRHDLSLETALRAVKNFSRRLDLELLVGPEGVGDPWYERAQVMDLEFVPLLTSVEIRAEATCNCNCLDWYGQRLASNEVRLYSLRTAKGDCVANVEISPSETNPAIPRVAQIKAPHNEAASSYASEVTEIWLRRQVRVHGYPDMKKRRPPPPDAQRWHAVMRPLAELGQLPEWAYRAPSNRDLVQTEIEFTMLGCRLHTRGWRFG